MPDITDEGKDFQDRNKDKGKCNCGSSQSLMLISSCSNLLQRFNWYKNVQYLVDAHEIVFNETIVEMFHLRFS